MNIKFTFIVLIIVIFGVSFSTLVKAEGQASPVRVKKVELRNDQKKQIVTGDLRAMKRSNVASKESGTLTRFKFKEGQSVRKGDILVEIDEKRVTLELNKEIFNAALAKAKKTKKATELSNYKKELERRVSANKSFKGAVSDESIQNAKAKVLVAAAALQVAEQDHLIAQTQMNLLQLRLKNKKIKAPFDGIIVKKHMEVGEWIKPGDSVVTLISNGQMEVELDVPEQFSLSGIKNMKDFRVNVGGLNYEVGSNDFRVIPDVNPRSRRFKVIATITPKAEELAPGMSVTAAIPSKEKMDYLFVSSNAILKDAGGEFVYKIIKSKDGTYVAMPISLRILFSLKDEVAVVCQNLKKGDQIVVEGNERLRPMASVSILKDKK